MTLDQYKARLKDAYEQYSDRADKLEQNGGAGYEIGEACAAADAYSNALAWVESVELFAASDAKAE